MAAKRKKIHDEYFRVTGHQIIMDYSDRYMADQLSCSMRTYKDKIQGWGDFTALQAKKLSELLCTSQDELFFTRDVSNSEQSA